MELLEYPRPDGDNGRGIHWFPILSQSRAVIDRFLPELEALHVRWVAMRCGLDPTFPNDYLVRSLLGRGIVPIILLSREGTEPMSRRELSIVRALVQHYRSLGVHYFQPYGEPNLSSSWREGKLPQEVVSRALDAWLSAADAIVAEGGLPGLFPLAPGGDYSGVDLTFLGQVFREMGRRSREDLYERMWVAIHNYTLDRPPNERAPDSHCFLKFLWYDEIIRSRIGFSLPILSTAGGAGSGSLPFGDGLSQRTIADWTVWIFSYMETAPSYYFCICPWLIGNALGGGQNVQWEAASWYRPDGTQQMVVDAVKAMPNRTRSPAPDGVRERYFPETGHWVRSPFLEFFQRYGPQVCGYPLTEAILDQGRPSQYFERVALEEYQPGNVRFKALGDQVLSLREEVRRLEDTADRLLEQLPSPITIAKPEIVDIADALPKDLSQRYDTRNLEKIELLVIHHTATKATITPETMAERSVEKLGKPAIDCHFVVAADGTIYQTNGLEVASSHAGDRSQEAIGICFAGDFAEAIPTEAQLRSGGHLLAYLLQGLGLSSESIKGAGELMDTQSPGRQWLKGKGWREKLLAHTRRSLEEEGKRFFPETGHSVSGGFLSFLNYYGLSVCGYPLTEVLEEEGLPAQVFQYLVLQEYDLGRVRPKPIGRELLDLRRRASLPRPPLVQKPQSVDISDELPTHPHRRYQARSLNQIDYLVIHHTATSPQATPRLIAEYHVKDFDWPGIGYHFQIGREGSIAQCNRLETVAYHAGEWNPVSVGICLVGNFEETPPTRAQLESAGHLCAWLLEILGLPLERVKGHGDLLETECPGRLWFQGGGWQDRLRREIESVLEASVTEETKSIDHYLLFGWRGESGAREDWGNARDYVAHFRPTCGFSPQDAMMAHYVTIIGGLEEVDEATEERLREAGCLVERVMGENLQETKRLLDGMVAGNRRFLTFPS